jgi:peptidyl-prolyl cis-trans isomerase A (cyclophilin A)
MCLRAVNWILFLFLVAGLVSCSGDENVPLSPESATEQAPEQFRVTFETTKGPFRVEVVREWAPLGADRFYNLVKAGFFNDTAFFRVIDGFIVQFGIGGDSKVNAHWKDANIADDPVKASNRRGFISFAMAGPNSRTTQMFINLADNVRLDQMRFAPVGRVVQGMEVVDSLYSDYGEGEPDGAGPSQDRINEEGNPYLRENFPKLDFIVQAKLDE